MEAATYHASRLADRFEIAGREMANHFGQISTGLMRIANTQTANEIDAIQDAARKDKLQAQIDFYQGRAATSDSEAYKMEIERLQTVEAARDARIKKNLARMEVRRAAARAKANTKAARRAAIRKEATEELATTGEIVTDVPDLENNRDILVDVNSQLVTDRVTQQLTEEARSGMSVDQLTEIILKEASEQTQGMDEVSRNSLINRVVKAQRRSIAHFIAQDRKAAIEKQQNNAETAAAGNWARGDYDDPDTGRDKFMADISKSADAYGGDVSRAIQGNVKAVVERAKMDIARGNFDAYQKVTTFINRTTTDNPELWNTAMAEVTRAYTGAYSANVRSKANALARAIAEGDEDAASQLFTAHTSIHAHPGYLSAFKAYQKFIEDKTTSTDNARHDQMWGEGRVREIDLKKAKKHADAVQLQLVQQGSVQSFVEHARERNYVGKDAKNFLQAQLMDLSALDQWEGDETRPGRAEDVVGSYVMLQSLPDHLRDTILSRNGKAVFAAVETLVSGGAGAPEALRKTLQLMKEKGDEINKADDRLNFSEFYIEAGSAVSSQSPKAARASFAGEVEDVVDEIHGSSDIPHMGAIVEEAGRLLKVQALLNNGVVTEEMRRDAIRTVARSYIAVPNVDAGLTGNDSVLVKPHASIGAARQVREAWEVAGDGREQFENGVSSVAAALPFVLSADSSIRPSLAPAPEVHASNGWMAVTGGDETFGSAVRVSPGAEMVGSTFEEVADTQIVGPGAVRTVRRRREETFEFPNDLGEFDRKIQAMNRLMLDSPFQWLREPGSSNANPVYYLGFRPLPRAASLPEQSTASELAALGEVATGAAELARKRLAELEQGVATGVNVTRPDTAGEARAEVVKDVLSRLTINPNSTVPRSLGLTVRVPDRFETSQDAMDYLQTAVNTHTINSRAGRPRPLRNTGLPDEEQAVGYLESWNGNSTGVVLDGLYRERREIGVGVPIDEPWVSETLTEKGGLTAQEVKDVRDGRLGLSAEHTKLLNVEAFKRSEETLRSKIDSTVLADLPWDAYMVLVGMVLDGSGALTDDLVGAVNSRDWVMAAEAIRGSLKGAKSKRIKTNLQRKRAIEATWFAAAFGGT